jgi:menaquinone-dependent protoporphyrinogen oxidase
MNDHRVLVAYSSRHGGTAEMAEWIAAELAEAGLPVDTRDIAAVDSLDGYDAVVLGSGAPKTRVPACRRGLRPGGMV